MASKSALHDLTKWHDINFSEMLKTAILNANEAYSNPNKLYTDVKLFVVNMPSDVYAKNNMDTSNIKIFGSPYSYVAKRADITLPNTYKITYAGKNKDAIKIGYINYSKPFNENIFAVEFNKELFINNAYESDVFSRKYFRREKGKYLLMYNSDRGTNSVVFGMIGAAIDESKAKSGFYLIDLESFKIIDLDSKFINSLIVENEELKQDLEKQKIKEKQGNWYKIIEAYNKIWRNKNKDN